MLSLVGNMRLFKNRHILKDLNYHSRYILAAAPDRPDKRGEGGIAQNSESERERERV